MGRTVILGTARTPSGGFGEALSASSAPEPGDVVTHSTEIPGVEETVNGGDGALGHPTGASGAHVPTTLVYELRRGGGRGLAAVRSGGGRGDAVPGAS